MTKIRITALIIAMSIIMSLMNTVAFAVPIYQTSDCILDVDMLNLTDLKTKVGETNGTALATSLIAPAIIDSSDESYIAGKPIRRFLSTDKNFIYTPASMNLLSTNKYSVELWMKPIANGFGSRLILAEPESVFSGTTGQTNAMFLGTVTKTTDIEFTFFTKSTSGTARAKYLVYIPKTELENQWVNLVLSVPGDHTYSGTLEDANANPPVIYVNTKPYIMQIPAANTGDIPTGQLVELNNQSVAFMGSKSAIVSGRVGAIRTYSKSLSSSEIVDLYNNDCEGYGLAKIGEETPMSSDNTLKSLSVSGKSFTQAFSSSQLEYTIEFPASETSVTSVSDVAYEVNDSKASAAIVREGSDFPFRDLITVMAENGTEKQYIINYVKLSSTSAEEIKVNFGVTAANESVEGYLPDNGSAYGPKVGGYTYGWDKDRTDETRKRGVEGDILIDTVMILNWKAPGVAETWTIDVPNAEYDVTVCVGDSGASTAGNNSHFLKVNDIVFFNQVGTSQNVHTSVTQTIDVRNGKIVITTDGATSTANKQTKLNYAIIKAKKITEVSAINLSANNLNMTKGGQSATITASVEPQDATYQNVIWSVEGDAVTISQNQNTITVNPVKGGTATIIATSKDGKAQSSCVVNVYAPPTSISVLQQDLTLALDGYKTQQLDVIVLPEDATNKEVTYEATGVVSVTQTGLVTANSLGNGSVIVKTIDGNLTSVVNITVVDKKINVSGINLDESNKTLQKGETVLLNASVIPSDATNKNIVYASSNENVAIVGKNGDVTAVSKGDAVITASTADGNFQKQVNITVLPTKVSAAANGSNLSIDLKSNNKDIDTPYNSVVLNLSTKTLNDQLITNPYFTGKVKNGNWSASDYEVVGLPAGVTTSAIGDENNNTVTITFAGSASAVQSQDIPLQIRIKPSAVLGSDTESDYVNDFKITCYKKVAIDATLNPDNSSVSMASYKLVNSSDDTFELTINNGLYKSGDLAYGTDFVLGTQKLPAGFTIKGYSYAGQNKIVFTVGTLVSASPNITQDVNFDIVINPSTMLTKRATEYTKSTDITVVLKKPTSQGASGGSTGGTSGSTSSYVKPITQAENYLSTTPPKVEDAKEVKNENMFKDLTQEWQIAPINYLYGIGVVKGKETSEFKPDDIITRSEFVALIVRALNIPFDTNNSEFTDVNPNDWCYWEVMAAKKAGIISGNGNEFLPDNPITREEMAVIIYNAMKLKNINSVTSFADNSDISLWALDAVKVLNEMKIINGVGDNRFEPKRSSTRAEGATVIYRMLTAKEGV